MSVRSRAAATGAAVLVLACAVTGCAGDADAGPPRAEPSKAGGPTAPVPPPGKEATEISVPLDRYGPSPGELETIRAAEDVLTGRCMRGKGVEWKTAPRVPGEETQPRNRRRYGVVEPRIAEIYGYHMPAERPAVARRAAAEKAREKGLGAAARKAAHGSGKAPGGCVRKAKETLTRGLPDADYGLLDSTLGATYDRALKEPEVVRVFRAWSACMKKGGYDYPGPMQAITDARWRKGDHVSREEIRQARADVRCKERTGLVAVWNAAETRVQRAAVKAEPAAFEKLEKARSAWVDAAKRVLEKA
ncbi:hypothetical protein GCM10009801_74260 [Streptomyces albiaxialis]|uniref:Lipoprotein n=1 Tax=Streptomyces albiaxialis TaxID=329523 RepID=A0ABP5IIU9_9ACTN